MKPKSITVRNMTPSPPRRRRRQICVKKFATFHPLKNSESVQLSTIRHNIATVGDQWLVETKNSDPYGLKRSLRNVTQLRRLRHDQQPITNKSRSEETITRYSCEFSLVVKKLPNLIRSAEHRFHDDFADNIPQNKEFKDLSNVNMEITISKDEFRFRRNEIVASTLNRQNYNERRRYTCPKCNKEFPYRYHMKKHVKNNECDGIDEEFKTQEDTSEINKKSTRFTKRRSCKSDGISANYNQNRHVCKQCYTSFPEVRLLETHTCLTAVLRKFTRGNFLCSLCGFRFEWLNELRLHEWSHKKLSQAFDHRQSAASVSSSWIKNLERKRYIDAIASTWCTPCNKNCYNEFAKTRHDEIHAKMRPFQCTFCNERFAETYFLILHIQLHEKVLKK